MQLYFEIINGPLKGEKFIITNMLSLGRSGQDINLNDPLVSTHHADIKINKNGDFVLHDNNSRNGLIFKGKSEFKITLKAGQRIKIGHSLLEVKTKNKKIISSDLKLLDEKENDFDCLKNSKSIAKHLINFSKNIKNTKLKLSAFKPAILLKITHGLQTNTQWTLGYGPRQIGSQSLEFPILELNAPKICFEIIPKKYGPQFITSHPDKILLNEDSVASQILKNKDVICFNSLSIEVNFIK